MNSSTRARPAGRDRRRKHRSRPTPRWLKSQSPEQAEARTRCLMVLSVLSGELPVSDAIGQAKISRATYYKLETRALQGMLLALDPMVGADPQASSVRERVTGLEAQVKRLEQQKRRVQRLLMLSHKTLRLPVRPMHRGRPSRKGRATANLTTAPGAISP